jgi:hypothetical protein
LQGLWTALRPWKAKAMASPSKGETQMVQRRQRRKVKGVTKPRSLRKGDAPFKKLPPMPEEGPKSEISPVQLKQIQTVCRLEANPSYKTIAEALGVTQFVLGNWMIIYEDLRLQIDSWRQAGLARMRRKAQALAEAGDGNMLRFMLERRDPDFKKNGDTTGHGDALDDNTNVPDPTFS